MPARQKPHTKEYQLAIRVPQELLDLLDAEAARLQAERPGFTVSRSDAVRETLFRALRPRGQGA